MMISVVIVNHNSAGYLRRCLSSLLKEKRNVPFEIIVVDNASSDESTRIIAAEFPQVKLVANSENVGFAIANNQGAAVASGKYLLFLNSDTVCIENSLLNLSDFMEKGEDIAAAGPRLFYEDGSFQLSAGRLPNMISEFTDKVKYSLAGKLPHLFRPVLDRIWSRTRDVGWLTGACMMVRSEVFKNLQGFDEKIFMYFEDKDLCKRMRDSGLRVVYLSSARFVHVLGGSSRRSDRKLIRRYYRSSQQYYYKKHHGRLQNILLNLYLGTRSE